MTLDIERYQSAIREFNDRVCELANKLEQIGHAREAALQASAALREELEASDKRLNDAAGAVRQQVTLEFDKKSASFEKVANHLDTRRVG